MASISVPVFLPGKSHEQRRLVGYRPKGHKESDTTDDLQFFSFNFFKMLPQHCFVFVVVAALEKLNASLSQFPLDGQVT